MKTDDIAAAAAFAPGDVLVRTGRDVPELGVYRFRKYEIAAMNIGDCCPLVLRGVPGGWSPAGFMTMGPWAAFAGVAD